MGYYSSFLIRQINTKRGRLNKTVTSFLGADRIRILVIIRSDSFKVHNQKNNNQVDLMELGAQIHMSIFTAKINIKSLNTG